MTMNIILFVLGLASIVIGILGIVKKTYDKKAEEIYTIESLEKAGLVSSICNIATGVGVMLCGLAYNSKFIPAVPYIYIFLVYVVLVLLADSIVENKILKKK